MAGDHKENEVFWLDLCYICNFYPLHQEDGVIHFLHQMQYLHKILFIFYHLCKN